MGKRLLVNFAKLLVCGAVYFVGLVIGGMIASLLGLPPAPMPEGAEQGTVMLYLLLESPVLALALALLARGIAAGRLARTLILSFLTWVAYTLNTVLEASVFMAAYASTSLFTIVSSIVPSFLCGAAVAWLFPAEAKGEGFAGAWKALLGRGARGSWPARMLLAAVAFMPIYTVFGLLVAPITGRYYTQGMFGLKAAGWGQILPVLFVRSVLFFAACLPVIVTWCRSGRSLFLRLGSALFILVGLLYMVSGYWLPLAVRVPHALEILADSFVYAWALTALLWRGEAGSRRDPATREAEVGR